MLISFMPGTDKGGTIKKVDTDPAQLKIIRDLEG
jgi:hypothetical protein